MKSLVNNIQLVRGILILFGCLFCWEEDQGCFAQGVLFQSMSSIGEGMGGASIATSMSAADAIYWNPASIVGFKQSQMQFGLGFALPKSELGSDVPGVGSGNTESTTGSLPLPSMAFVNHRKGKRLHFGLAAGVVGGAATLYEMDPSNPIMLDPESLALGIEIPIVRSSDVQICQVIPAFAWRQTDQLSFGFSPILNIAKLQLMPSPIPGPVMPSNVGTRYFYGGGFQAGVYFDTRHHIKFGATIKSPQWMEKSMSYSGSGSRGFPINLPLTIGLGTSYTGFLDTVIAWDVRYLDYGNTLGFKEAGYDEKGEFVGLGWRSVFSTSIGVERTVTCRLKLRAGYAFNENPISRENQMWNVASPMIYKHSIHLGGTYTFGNSWDLSVAYAHMFRNESTGPLLSSLTGASIGTVTNSAQGNIISTSITKRF